jgi:hypothetical protein
MKTLLAPGFKARLLGMNGWFSTNILGNRDGEVLDDPESFKTKEESKKSVLDYIFQAHLYPDLYKEIHHVVRINYYPPRGDNKEGWDNVDLVGWLGYPMQLKINFLCRDSILAAPIVLDVALLLDLAKRAGLSGIQEWLSFYFKSPQHAPGLYPEHDLFIQLMKLKNTLRYLKGEELITHLGAELSAQRAANGGRLPDRANDSLVRHVSFLESAGEFPAAEATWNAELAVAVNAARTQWLEARLHATWATAIRQHGTTALGSGRMLYEEAQRRVLAQLETRSAWPELRRKNNKLSPAPC